MGHGKLRKFAENETFRCLVQPSAEDVIVSSQGGLVLKDHPLKGRWNEVMFDAPRPIVLELGCGRGEYTIDLSRRIPGCNYIGVDIKGARLWKGAKYATQNALGNVAFLRTRIEFIESFFAPGEISKIWLTFSDPQMGSENSRLTSPVFLERYRKFLAPGGMVCLKTDSMFLHQYSLAVARANSLEVSACSEDLYARPGVIPEPGLYDVQTYYEKMFLQMGLKITYMAFRLDHEGAFVYPEDFDAAYWKALEGPRRTFDHNPSSSKVQ
ncbi:MAG: tRNA (guanosine(46)-N7)-methyltransferase TrmB [Bacteroidales bacterium]|nr:tRNA (guanosine(46)-N7)-methyltransferase TrmB [Bacteroidales bacterium]